MLLSINNSNGKFMIKIICAIILFVVGTATSYGCQNISDKFDNEQFAQQYFTAWTATQSTNATKQDIENYLALLTDDIGHQHFPYDINDERSVDGKKNMRKGMNYYLATHAEYQAKLNSEVDTLLCHEHGAQQAEPAPD